MTGVTWGANLAGAGGGAFGARRSAAEEAAEEVKNALWTVERLQLVDGRVSTTFHHFNLQSKHIQFMTVSMVHHLAI